MSGGMRKYPPVTPAWVEHRATHLVCNAELGTAPAVTEVYRQRHVDNGPADWEENRATDGIVKVIGVSNRLGVVRSAIASRKVIV